VHPSQRIHLPYWLWSPNASSLEWSTERNRTQTIKPIEESTAGVHSGSKIGARQSIDFYRIRLQWLTILIIKRMWNKKNPN
jgi:hypothetical protein